MTPLSLGDDVSLCIARSRIPSPHASSCRGAPLRVACNWPVTIAAFDQVLSCSLYEHDYSAASPHPASAKRSQFALLHDMPARTQ